MDSTGLILNLLTLGVRPVYLKHLEYWKIIEDFSNKLPRQQNEARVIPEAEKREHPVLSALSYMTVLDVSTHKVSLNETDIDLFYNKLNSFDYRLMLFPKYYKNYTANLNRFSPNAENKNFNLVMLQKVLKGSLYPIKPLDILIFNLKWEVGFTSKIYLWCRRTFKIK